MASFINSKRYKKRPGTFGIQGHLYETKLLSLIYFRALHDDNIQKFYLATNVDKLGSFDDICFRVKVNQIEKPLTVLIQAKHRENDTVLKLNSKSDLIKHFNSYLKVRNKFKPNNEDVLFDGEYSDTECLFVIYTTAKSDESAQKYKSDSATFLNALIGTEVLGSSLQPLDDSKHAELNQLLLEEELLTLARLIAKCMYGDLLMLNVEDVVLRYHAILAQKVFDVSSEHSEGFRDARLRQDFFDINEETVQTFKEKLCTEILKRRKFLSDISSSLPNDEYLAGCSITDIYNQYQKVKHLIIYEDRKFKFVDKIRSAPYKSFLDKINESQDTIQKILEIAIKQSLPSPTFKVPAWFGNKDLTIRGGDRKTERKLIDLTSKLIRLIEKSRPNNIIIIDESLGKAFLQLSGGIASAVGNLLVFDEDSNMLKFNDNRKLLGELAGKLFDHLTSKIEYLYEYRFDVRVKIFPKLSFDADEYTKNIIRDFSNKLLFYTSQAKEAKVETMTIDEIKKKMCHDDDVHTSNIKSNTIFHFYHDAIQKWWMKKEGEYLTKESSLYKNAEKDVLSQSFTGLINMMQRVKIKKYTFTEDAVNSIKLDEQLSGTVILSKNIRLTVAKLVNHLIKKSCIVLDMQYILNMNIEYTETLQKELIDLNQENILIYACDKAIFGAKYDESRIICITKSIKTKTVIIILNDQNFIENAKKYFIMKDTVLKDERNSLIDMNEESQKSILRNTNVIFHGVEVNLDLIIDEKSLGLVEELVLYKLMQNDKCIIGKPAGNLNDREKVYIERSVKCLKVVTRTLETEDKKIEEGEIKKISSLHDLENDIVLIIGEPGMGKSTLFTQLFLMTKQRVPTDWIVRINLLEYSKQFCTWQENKTVIDTLKSLKFLCQATISKNPIKREEKGVKITLEDLDGAVLLKGCDGDEWTIFQLKLFLHYYNTKQLIILLDGLDEICPTYEREAFSLIKTLMNLHRKHKIWITSRSYHKVIAELNLNFLYKLEPFNNVEQDLYLSAFWKEKNLLKKINHKMIRNNLSDFCFFMTNSIDLRELKSKIHLSDESINKKPILAVYLSLLKYLKPTHTHHYSMDLYNELSSEFSELVANPLHLNLLADHILYNKIDVRFADDYELLAHGECGVVLEPYDEEQAKFILWNNMSATNLDNATFIMYNLLPTVWDLDVNLFEIYERFLEYKLKIRLEEKNHIDLSMPYNRELYKRVYREASDGLKKLAAYVVYNKRLLNKHELKCCEEIINKVKHGEENTDIICNVVNDIPIFVHSTFADYFAVEYICQLIKEQHDSGINLENIFDFILNVIFFELNKNILAILDAKIMFDVELTSIMEDNRGIILRLLLKQNKIVKNRHRSRGDTQSSLCEAIRLGLKNLAYLLSSATYIFMNDFELTNLVNIAKNSNMLMVAIKMGFDDLLISFIDNIRIINESKLNELFENIEIFYKNENYEEVSTDELVQLLHAYVWTRMDIVPDWENLQEFCGHIHFI
ncbi:hypothetical protein PYW08_001816 [Mythimna loreyi]|uniref:Uncharacterized protein n=1 Tax=Mythimna loreyi TaxID=667449 RepID=A0ACC2R596_9NEOP|nr:hypothetical protein PYW08_001816 [Mythimna loreyi]